MLDIGVNGLGLGSRRAFCGAFHRARDRDRAPDAEIGSLLAGSGRFSPSSHHLAAILTIYGREGFSTVNVTLTMRQVRIEDPMGPAAKRDEGRTRPEGPAPLSPGEAVLVIGVLSALCWALLIAAVLGIRRVLRGG